MIQRGNYVWLNLLGPSSPGREILSQDAEFLLKLYANAENRDWRVGGIES
jgi:hypothetical protein